LSHVPDFHDATARVFLNERGKRSLAKVEVARDGTRGTRYEAARVMADMIALRTSAIDKAVRDAIADGAEQLVILGAGYDGRAWRMPELAGVRVFEIDHPDTQAEKRARMRALPPATGIVNFIPMDFAQESLDKVLDRAGHDRLLPTCWIWEGVVMYLPRDVVRMTLSSIAARSTHGSTLIVNYHGPGRGFLAMLMFRLLGEPQISFWTKEEMQADLQSARFVVLEDSGMLDWNRQFAHNEAKVERGFYMRIATART
jgi:methyltransferase (TIGR00027 family)